jgi:hypothetical protein
MSGLAAGCSKGVTTMGGVPFGPTPGSASNGDEDEEDETTDDEQGSSSGGESDPILTSGPDNTSDASITTAPGTTSGSPDSTTGVSGPEPSSSGFPGESSSGPVGTSGVPMPSGEPCADYGEWAANCYGVTDGEEFCYYLISYYGTYYGPGCAAAFEELIACVSTQPCGAVGCANEQNAVSSAC